MARTEEQERLRESSGSITSSDPLIAFLYSLMRDQLPAGTIAALVNDATKSAEPSEFTNGWLAQYAQHLAARLRPSKE